MAWFECQCASVRLHLLRISRSCYTNFTLRQDAKLDVMLENHLLLICAMCGIQDIFGGALWLAQREIWPSCVWLSTHMRWAKTVPNSSERRWRLVDFNHPHLTFFNKCRATETLEEDEDIPQSLLTRVGVEQPWPHCDISRVCCL